MILHRNAKAARLSPLRLNSWRWWSVDNISLSPILKGISGDLFLLAKCVWKTLACRRLSFASATSLCSCVINDRAQGFVLLPAWLCQFGGDDGGYYTWRSSKSDLEVGESGGCVDGIHNVESDAGKGTDPAFLVLANVITNALVHGFVRSFASAVGLGVVQRWEF